MNKQDKSNGVRRRLLILSLFTIFLLYILFKFLIPDYFVQEGELQKDSGIIENAFKNKYLDYEKYKGKVYKSCVDIILVDKPYFIRLTDHLVDNYWNEVIDSKNISKDIEVKFQGRLLHDKILYNPNQVAINGKVIIPYDAKKEFEGWFAIVVTLLTIVCLYILHLFIKSYKMSLFAFDKAIAQKNKWKLLRLWFWD